MANELECITINDVRSEFRKISRQGCLMSVTSTKDMSTGGHSQGSNYYVDENGVRYFIVAHDNQKDDEAFGYLVIFKESPSAVDPIIVETPTGYNHPGSFQILGNYLFLPVENYKASYPDGDYKSMVCVYDLAPLANGNAPVLLENTKNYFKDHKAGMLGVTDEWLAIHDNSDFYLYRIVLFDGRDDGTLQLESYNSGDCSLDSFQGIGLVKETTGALYLIGFCSDYGLSTTFEDKIVLYRIETDGQNSHFVVLDKEEYDVSTDHGKGVGGWLSIHFRYGGGVYLYSDYPEGPGHIVCLGTGRNINKEEAFNYNHFSSSDSLEIMSQQTPLSGQKNRASGNFSIKGFQKKKVRFTVLKNGKEDTEIKFYVYKDKTGSDSRVYGKKDGETVASGSTYELSGESPLYIYAPTPEKKENFKIVMEGFNG
ncbi:MAG: hypothetical protein LUE16_07210 [Lachnospiraceae bacterium]|nr:hypothetical protein [Lachnospiraceae bacterium]